MITTLIGFHSSKKNLMTSSYSRMQPPCAYISNSPKSSKDSIVFLVLNKITVWVFVLILTKLIVHFAVWTSDLLSESHKRYGSIVKLWLGPTQLLVSVKDPVLIQEMLLKAEDKLPFTGKAFRLAFGQSSLFSSSFEKV